MSAFLKALFQKYATRLIIGTGEGIKQIPNKDRVNRMVANLYNDFKAAGVTDNMIKSEKDIKILHHQVAEINNQKIVKQFEDMMKTKKSADVLDLTGKKIDTSKPILGGKNVTESGMLDDNYKELKKEWFGRIIANTDDDINTFLNGLGVLVFAPTSNPPLIPLLVSIFFPVKSRTSPFFLGIFKMSLETSFITGACFSQARNCLS